MNNSITKQRQSGVVLIISLIMLLLLTILGVTGMQVNSLEEKMSGNAYDQSRAFQAAESTLIVAEKFVLDNPLDALVYDGADGLLNIAHDEPANFFSYDWTKAAETALKDSFNLAENPRYIVKKVSINGDQTFFRITARATGGSSRTQVILQEYFVRTN